MTKDEALKLALKALEYEAQKGNDNAYQSEREAIKAALEAKDEPVAWAMLHDNGHFIDAIHPNEHARVEGEYITPLYTTPPQRKPLTDETRNWIVATCPTPRHIIDAVERMHGIKGEA
jgi:hypothetical protein